MSKYEVGQTWSNGTDSAVIASIYTSYDYTYIRYEINGKAFECDVIAFDKLMPTLEVAKVTEATMKATNAAASATTAAKT